MKECFKICNFSLKKLKGYPFYFWAFIRISFLVVKNFFKNKGTQIASSLTFYSLLSLVPIVAFSFIVAERLGLEEFLERGLLERFQEHQEILDKTLSFIHNLFEIARSSVVSGISVGILFLSVIKLINIIENYFSLLWKSENKRKLKNKVIIYCVLILLFPTFLILSGVIKVIVIQKMQYFFLDLPLFYILKFLTYFLVWLLFTVIYLLLPKEKVQFGKAVISGFLAGVLYESMQWVYIYFQIKVGKYNAIYSSFAALPLFLIWIQISWMIFLLGAQLTAVLKNLYECEHEKACAQVSLKYQQILSIFIVHRIITTNQKVSQKFLYQTFNIPFALSQILLNKLVRAKILSKRIFLKKTIYESRVDLLSFTIKDLLDSLNSAGINEVEFIKIKELDKIKAILKSFDSQIDKTKENLLLKNLNFS